MKFVYQTVATVALAATVVCGIAQRSEAIVLAKNSNSTLSLNALVPASNTISDDFAGKLQKTLDQAIADSKSAGAAVGITTPQGSWFGASGVSDFATGTAVVPQDRFQIGSITKTFVSTTILQLMEEGKLSLDDTLNQWLSPTVTQYVDFSDRITIRQLLNHTSGVYNYTNKLFPDADTDPSLFLRDWSPVEIVSYAGEPNDFAPGESWNYSNTNYILLGMIAEAATNSTIEREIRSRILEPLGMNNTFFDAEEEIPGGYVRGYVDLNQDGDFTDIVNGIPEDVSVINMSSAWAAGAMVSNTQDLTRFTKGLFDGELLSSDTLKEMLTFVETKIPGFGYGLGVISQDVPGVGKFWGHDGGTAAFSANMWYSPNLGITYVDLQNSRPASNIIEPTLNVLLEGDRKSVPEPSAIAGLIAIAVTGVLLKRKTAKAIKQRVI